MINPFITQQDAANFLHVTRVTIQNLIRNGLIKTIPHGYRNSLIIKFSVQEYKVIRESMRLDIRRRKRSLSK